MVLRAGNASIIIWINNDLNTWQMDHRADSLSCISPNIKPDMTNWEDKTGPDF